MQLIVRKSITYGNLPGSAEQSLHVFISTFLNTSSQGKVSLQALTITIFNKEQLTYSLLNYLKILLYCADKTETKVAAAEVGVVAAPAVHPAVVGIVVPAAAATTAVAAVVRADTPAPLPNVTAHII